MTFDDAGQGMLPLMVLVAFMVLVVMFWLLVPWGAATTEKAQSQTAADAAALAAVQQKRTVFSELTAPGTLVFPLHRVPVQAARLAGLPAAEGFAAANDARLTSYSGFGREVVVEVENLRTSDADTGRARATATASMRVDLDGCGWDDPLPEAPVTSGGLPVFERTLLCGEWSARYRITNSPPVYRTISLVDTTEDRLFNRLEPRLVD